MADPYDRPLNAARAAIIGGDPIAALKNIEVFMGLTAGLPVSDIERTGLEARIAELRMLAEAAQQGAQSALDQVRAIIQAARSLQTYDSGGKLRVNMVAQDPARRY